MWQRILLKLSHYRRMSLDIFLRVQPMIGTYLLAENVIAITYMNTTISDYMSIIL